MQLLVFQLLYFISLLSIAVLTVAFLFEHFIRIDPKAKSRNLKVRKLQNYFDIFADFQPIEFPTKLEERKKYLLKHAVCVDSNNSDGNTKVNGLYSSIIVFLSMLPNPFCGNIYISDFLDQPFILYCISSLYWEDALFLSSLCPSFFFLWLALWLVTVYGGLLLHHPKQSIVHSEI